MVDVKVTILYIHGAGHVQGGWLYAVRRKNCDMTGGVLVGGAGTNPVQSVIGCFFWGLSTSPALRNMQSVLATGS